MTWTVSVSVNSEGFLVVCLRFVTCCVFSRDSALLATGSMDRTVKIWKLTDTSRIMGGLLLVVYFDWLIDHVYNGLIHRAWADSLWLSVTQQVTVALHSAFESPPKRCSVRTGWDVVGAIQNGCHLCACSVHTLQPCFSLVLFKATCVHPVKKGMLRSFFVFQ